MKKLLNLANPEFVYYCPVPLPLAKPTDLVKLSIAEISKLLGKSRNRPNFVWSTDIQVPNEWVLTDEDQAKLAALKARMIPAENLAVCRINKELGFGIFTLANIKQGSVAIYCGEHVPTIHNFRSQSLYTLQADETYSIDAIDAGSFSALFMDLLSAEISLDGFPIDVAKNNFVANRLALSCGSISYLEAATDIGPRMQCGLSYQHHYWNSLYQLNGTLKKFIDTKGQVIADEFMETALRYQSLSKLQLNTVLGGYIPKTAKELADSFVPGDAAFISMIKEVHAFFGQGTKPKEEKQVTAAVPEIKDAKLATSLQTLPNKNMFTQNNNALLKPILDLYKVTEATADAAFRKAAGDGRVDHLQILQKHLAININATSSNGMSALHWAYEFDRDAVIDYLLTLSNIKTDCIDSLGRKPIDCKTTKRPVVNFK